MFRCTGPQLNKEEALTCGQVRRKGSLLAQQHKGRAERLRVCIRSLARETKDARVAAVHRSASRDWVHRHAIPRNCVADCGGSDDRARYAHVSSEHMCARVSPGNGSRHCRESGPRLGDAGGDDSARPTNGVSF